MKVLQVQLDQLNRFRASDRDLYLYLFQWLLTIICSIAAAGACAVIAAADSDKRLYTLGLVFLMLAVVSTLVLLPFCGSVTTVGIMKKTAKLEADIAKLQARL